MLLNTLKRKRKILIPLIIIVLVAGVVLMLKKQSSTLPVKEVFLQNVKVARTVSATGAVTSDSSSDESFPSAGQIVSILVKEGESVLEGDLIATLNKGVISNTAQSYKDARDIVLRNRDLFVEQYEDNKDAAGGEVEYEIKLRTLDEQVSQAQASYDAYLAQIRNTNIYSKISGTVVDVILEPGDVVAAGASVIKIADLAKMTFEIELDQEDIGSIEIGQNDRLRTSASN